MNLEIVLQLAMSNHGFKEKILSLLDENGREVFTRQLAYYRLLNDSEFSTTVQTAIGEELYKELCSDKFQSTWKY